MRSEIKIKITIFGACLILAFLSGCSPGCPLHCLGERPGAVDWSGKNLQNAKVIGSILRQSNLSHVNFTHADLSGTDFSGANFKSADLTDALLIGSNLEGAYLSGATLSRTDFSGAKLSSADLTGVTFTSSKLTSVNFYSARLVNANMSQLNLAGSYMDKAQMRGIILNRANLAGALLDQVDLSGADLRYADLSGSWINLSSMVAANLQNANLSGASLIGTDMSGCDLSGASLSGANLIGAVLRGADLRGANLSSAVIIASPDLVDRKNQDDATLQKMSEAQWAKLYLGDTILVGVKYDDFTKWPEGFGPPTGAIYQPNELRGEITFTPDQSGASQIIIAGSTITHDLVDSLARAYMTYHPDTYFTLVVNDSNSGIAWVGNNNANIGMSSRALKQAEKEQYQDLKEIPLANDSIVVVVNLGNPISQITMEQLRSVFSGDINNWKDIGGLDMPIKPLVQDTTLMEVFSELVMKNTPIAADSRSILPSSTAIRAAVAAEQGAVGLLPNNLIDDSIKKLALNGTQANPTTILSGEYPLIRPLYLVTRGEPSGAIQDWLDFIFSKEGEHIIILTGLEPNH